MMTDSEFVNLDDLVIDNDTTDRHDSKVQKAGENYKMTDTIEKILNLSVTCIKNGQFMYKDIIQFVADIAGVGGIVKAVLRLIPDDNVPDGVLTKLGELEKKVDELADQMNAKFDDMKSFITEVNFYVEIMNPASNLMKYMMDCLNHPVKEAVENFKQAYLKHPPLELAYSLLSLLGQQSTNPLKMAMEADPLKTKTTFNKWENIISGVLAEFLFLEAFGNGLLEIDSAYNSERIVERSNQLFKVMEGWKEEYKKTNRYWVKMPKLVKELMENHASLSNAKKADRIEELFDSILTRDSFYIIVFNKWTTNDGYRKFTFYNVNDNQLIQLYNSGGSSVLVYRSLDANRTDEKSLLALKQRVIGIDFDVREFITDPKKYPEKLSLRLMSATFICVIGEIGEEVRWANCHKNDGQPGWSHEMVSEPDRNGKRTKRRLVAGFT